MAQKRAEMIEETRAKLISAARAAFATVGYADSSMDELTAQAGLTRGALYHHFGGKKGLLEAVIAHQGVSLLFQPQIDPASSRPLRSKHRRATPSHNNVGGNTMPAISQMLVAAAALLAAHSVQAGVITASMGGSMLAEFPRLDTQQPGGHQIRSSRRLVYARKLGREDAVETQIAVPESQVFGEHLSLAEAALPAHGSVG